MGHALTNSLTSVDFIRERNAYQLNGGSLLKQNVHLPYAAVSMGDF